MSGSRVFACAAWLTFSAAAVLPGCGSDGGAAADSTQAVDPARESARSLFERIRSISDWPYIDQVAERALRGEFATVEAADEAYLNAVSQYSADRGGGR